MSRHRCAEREGLRRPHAVADCDYAVPRELSRDQTVGVFALAPGHDPHIGRTQRAGVDRRHLELRHDHGRVAHRRNDEAGQPIRQPRVVPGQIEQVGAWRDKQGRDPGLLGRGSRPLKPGTNVDSSQGTATRQPSILSGPAPIRRSAREGCASLVQETPRIRPLAHAHLAPGLVDEIAQLASTSAGRPTGSAARCSRRRSRAGSSTLVRPVFNHS